MTASEAKRRNSAFNRALFEAMKRKGHSSSDLIAALDRPSEMLDRSLITRWRTGERSPHTTRSRQLVRRIERHYGMPAGKLTSLITSPSGAREHPEALNTLTSAQRSQSANHLPEDFWERSQEDQGKIVDWIRANVLTTGTMPRARLMQGDRSNPLALPLTSGLDPPNDRLKRNPRHPDARDFRQLQDEIHRLVQYYSCALPENGFFRSGRWSAYTAKIRVNQLGLLFGTLIKSSKLDIIQRERRLVDLTVGLLVFPEIWDDHMRWREARRGFYNSWDSSVISLAIIMSHPKTGWLTQNEPLAERIKSLPGFVSEQEVWTATQDWREACNRLHFWAIDRKKALNESVRVSRDVCKPIRTILEADEPLKEYLRIPEEVYRTYRGLRINTHHAARTCRDFLILRLALHLGVRSRNLRQLLLTARGDQRRSFTDLVQARCGDLRWNSEKNAWIVYLPREAFKNKTSRLFHDGEFELILPDVADLYSMIEDYIKLHRPRLLRGREDPGTLFVTTRTSRAGCAAFSEGSFYVNWIQIIRNYGIYNPFTGRGAIQGMLPHGPHAIRSVIAVHILKATGSYLHASYALCIAQNTVRTHYSRFIPSQKVELAASILGRVWK